MIDSQNSVTSTSRHVDLSKNQNNRVVLALINFLERGKNGIISLIKRSFIQAFVYFHFLYNVCYSMAKTDNNQESGNSDNLFTKTLLIDENSDHGDDAILPVEDESMSVKTCSHINKAIDINNVRKNVSRHNGFSCLKCTACQSEKNLFLCLKCGTCNCSGHTRKHYESPRSDPHNLSANVDDWSIWCYKCDTEISLDHSGKLKDGIMLLKKEQNKSARASPLVANNCDIDRTSESNTPVVNTVMETATCYNSNRDLSMAVIVRQKSQNLPTVRGLTNLGNTCFFNSVLQCLAQTPFLLELLFEISEAGEVVTISLDKHSQLRMVLDKWGPVTEQLAWTLSQMTQSSGGAFSPGHLLEALRKKCRQFVGYSQHDAHELLRQLLDSVKMEDTRRYQFHILQHFGLSRKTNPLEIDEKKKAMAKELNQKLSDIVNIRPDPVFKGLLVSAHRCMKCHHKSEVVENFLDLSLPVSFIKSQPTSVIRRRSDFIEKPMSKHQKKKEKNAARKASRLAKIKKRSKDGENTAMKITDMDESGYSSGKAASPEQRNENQSSVENAHNEILTEALNEMNSTSSKNINEVDNSTVSSITDGVNEDYLSNNFVSSEMCAKPNQNNSAIELNNVSPTLFPVSNNIHDEDTSQVHAQTSPAPDMRFCLTNSCGVTTKTSDSSASNTDDEKDNEDNDDEDVVDDNDDVSDDESMSNDTDIVDHDLCATLKPPYEYEENSIQACLNQFTVCEVLTGNNKLKCESCTERQSKLAGEKKPVYQPITKQLLIKLPPPVLILHLKRFEMRSMFSFGSASLRKVEKVITFPLVLDIGPFCAASCEKLLIPGQKDILYSLYGVVEHSGSLHAGHYVAYVKVRKQVDRQSYRKLFLPKSYSNEMETLDVNQLEDQINEHCSGDKQWYYVSDSYVRSISEEEVLHKQAYLLFYERVK